MRPPLRPGVVIAVCALVAALVAGPSAASAAGSSCSVRWGSLDRSTRLGGDGPLVDVRAGRHACFDRLVFDVAGAPAPGYMVRYVPEVHADGSGLPVPVAGGARLEVIVAAPAYDPIGQPTYVRDVGATAVDVSGFRTFRDIRYAGSFEGLTTLAVGVRARLPFRVFGLEGPGGCSRVVLDVAHRW